MDRSTMLGLLAQSLARSSQDDPLPDRLCRAGVDVMGADGGALTLSSTTPGRVTVSASDDTSATIEDLQEVLGEGPGQTAFREGRPVVAPVDGEVGRRFPMFDELAGAAMGTLTVYAIPMRTAGTVIGVLTLYALSGALVHGLGDAQLLADAIGAAIIANADAVTGPEPRSWPRRARVHRATGMVVAQLAVGADDAFALLRAHAFAAERSLDAVARDVLDRRLVFVADESHEYRIATHETRNDET